MKIKLYYHGNCPDGFGSAWAFYQKYGDTIEYEKFFYGKKIKPSDHDIIYFADCSISKENLEELNKQSKVIVIDHHKTAYENLEGYEFLYFNINNSGCVLSWKYLFKEKPVPQLLQYIEDRDLWKWKLKNTKEILCYLDSLDFNFFDWSKMNDIISTNEGFLKIKESGSDILRYQKKLVKIFSKNSDDLKLHGYNGTMVNSPFFQGEIADEFKNKDFIIVYTKINSGYKCSIRTSKSDVDVSLIAKHFGGGGHQKASGFLLKSLNELYN